jgi:hypothetical protein
MRHRWHNTIIIIVLEVIPVAANKCLEGFRAQHLERKAWPWGEDTVRPVFDA